MIIIFCHIYFHPIIMTYPIVIDDYVHGVGMKKILAFIYQNVLSLFSEIIVHYEFFQEWL